MRRRKDSWANPLEPLDPNRKTARRKETAEFLRTIIEENNLETKDVAIFLDVAPSSIRGYKNATRELPEDKIKLLEKEFCHSYISNECEKEVFTTRYKLISFLKNFNLNYVEQFDCVKYNLLAILDNQEIAKEVKENIVYNTDISVIEKYISKNFLQFIKEQFVQIQKDIDSPFIFQELSNISPKDVINENNIPCFRIDELDIDNIFNSPIEMYIDIPSTLTRDSYDYFGIVLTDNFNYSRYHSQDILVIRKGDSFAFDYDDELLVIEDGKLTFKSFEYIDFEEHQHIISVTDCETNTKKEYSSIDIQDIEVIGTVVAIFPRVLQDKKEKERGIFNRKLRTLDNLPNLD